MENSFISEYVRADTAGEDALKKWLGPQIESLYKSFGQIPTKEEAENLRIEIIKIALKEKCLVANLRDAFNELLSNYTLYRKVCFASFYTAYKRKK